MLEKAKKNQKGFTLVELVVVIAILGILSALVVPRIIGNVEEARKNRDIATARTIASEITVHNASTEERANFIPTGKVPAVDATTEYTVLSTDMTGVLAAYADTFPDSQYAEINVDGQGNATVDIK